MTTNLVYTRCILPVGPGVTQEFTSFVRVPLEFIPQMLERAKTNTGVGLVYVNPCNTSYIQDDEWDKSRFPEGAEL